MTKTQPNRWMLLGVGALCYCFGALTISWAMSAIFPESDLDRVAVRYYALFFAASVWVLGAGYASVAISISKQWHWWPISIVIAAAHGGIVVLVVTWLFGGSSQTVGAAATFSFIGAIAAGLSYGYYLVASWIIWRRSAPLAQRLPV